MENKEIFEKMKKELEMETKNFIIEISKKFIDLNNEMVEELRSIHGTQNVIYNIMKNNLLFNELIKECKQMKI